GGPPRPCRADPSGPGRLARRVRYRLRVRGRRHRRLRAPGESRRERGSRVPAPERALRPAPHSRGGRPLTDQPETVYAYYQVFRAAPDLRERGASDVEGMAHDAELLFK